MYSNLFSPDSIAELTVAMQTQFPKAIWETFYVTLLSTALAVVIGLPLGVLLVAGEKGGVLPLPKALMSILNVIINLLPGWIEEHDHKRSSSGSMYGYDTRVPLIFYGAGILPRQIDRPVDMTAVAPTLCRLLGIEAPAASEGTVLEEVISSNI